MIIRIALIVALCLFTLRAEAYPASGGQWRASNYIAPGPTFGGPTGYDYATGDAACQPAAVGNGLGCWQSFWGGGSGTATFTSRSGADCTYTLSSGQTTVCVQVHQQSGFTCPNGGTLSGSTCTCAAGETDNGTACVPNNCPATGAAMGSHNLTVGWALSPTVGAPDIVGGSVAWAAYYGGPHCVPDGGNMCGSSLDPGAMDQGNCWRAQAPSESGLYRISCDTVMISTGSACTNSSGTPSSPSSAAPACPTGNVGEVNGKPVCLGTIPAAGITLPGSELPGNPSAGSPAEASNEAREPTAGNGGGPDQRGGPGVTTGPGGSVGTGGNRTPGSGDGKGESPKLELPTDYNREVTQGKILDELKKARKIDETGTPNADGVDTDAKSAVDGEATKLTTKLDSIIAGEGAPDRSWGMSISFPSTCNPFVVGTANWGFFNVDFCDFQDVAHDLMTLVWLGVTIFCCVGMVFRAVNAG